MSPIKPTRGICGAARRSIAAIAILYGAVGVSGCAEDAPASSLPATAAPSGAPQLGAVLPTGFPLALQPPPSNERILRPYLAWDVRDTAAVSLGRIGPAAVPYLRQALSSPHADVRQRCAAEVLARIGPRASDATEGLIALLKDENPGVRKTAAWSLGQIGPAAERAVPELMRILVTPASEPADASR